MKGRGSFWENVGNWFVQAGKDVNQFLKDSKLVSNVAAYALPILGAMGGALLTVNPLGAAAGGIAGKSTADYIKSQGYGSKKMHGGELSNKLVINPANQRMRGIMGKGLLEDALKTIAPSVGLAISNTQNAIKKLKGKGANDTFGMNGVQQKHTAPMKAGIMKNQKGSGGYGQDYRLKKGLNPKCMVGTGGIPYGSISSEFGNVKF